MAGRELGVATASGGWTDRPPLLAGGLLVGVNLADVAATVPNAALDQFVVITRTAIYQMDITGWVWLHSAVATSAVVAGIMTMVINRRWTVPVAAACAALNTAIAIVILPYVPIRATLVIAANAAAIRLLVRAWRARPLSG